MSPAFPRILGAAFILLLALGLGAKDARADDCTYTAGSGGVSLIVGPDGVCKGILNNNTDQVCAPTAVTAEWQSFYNNPPANVTITTCCIPPWGGALATGSSVTAYSSSSVACGTSCTSESRTCTSGTLSGSYTNQTCSSTCAGYCYSTYCYFADSNSTSGGSGSGGDNCNTVCGSQGGCSSSGTVYIGSGDTSGARCGAVATGIYGSSLTATASNQGSTTPGNAWGCFNFPTKGSNTIYDYYGATTTCAQSGLSAGYYPLCACATGSGGGSSCTLPWGGTISDGQCVTAYQYANRNNCNGLYCSNYSESRCCSNGTLSGTFTNASCSDNYGSCGGGCFAAGVEILMADGSTKPIEEIKKGDVVMSYDIYHPDSKLVPNKVVATVSYENKRVLRINGLFIVTPDHKFPQLGKKGARKAGEFRLGDKLIAEDGSTIEITKMEYLDAPQTVYNFEVEHFHSYVANGVRTNNMMLLPQSVEEAKRDSGLLQRVKIQP